MKKFLDRLSGIFQISLVAILLPNFAHAKDYNSSKVDNPELVSGDQEVLSDERVDNYDEDQYPKFSGEIDAKYKVNRITSGGKSGVAANEGMFGIDSNYSLNFNKNLSAKSTVTLYPIIKGDSSLPENELFFRSKKRGFQLNNTALIIEGLTLCFENEDFKVFAGKFDPTFGPSYDDSEISGVFSGQFRADYDLFEGIGAGGAVNFNDNTLKISTFYDDNTELRRSALARRNMSEVQDGDAANTSSLSSYTAVLEGKNLAEVENLSYSIGYRSLGVEKMPGVAREIGYVGSLAYSFELQDNLILTPFIELIKVNNYSGIKGHNDFDSIIALSAKYYKWRASILGSKREIKQSNAGIKIHDHQLQFSVGYQFTERLGLDLSAMNLKENNVSGFVVGAMIKYAYKF